MHACYPRSVPVPFTATLGCWTILRCLESFPGRLEEEVNLPGLGLAARACVYYWLGRGAAHKCTYAHARQTPGYLPYSLQWRRHEALRRGGFGRTPAPIPRNRSPAARSRLLEDTQPSLSLPARRRIMTSTRVMPFGCGRIGKALPLPIWESTAQEKDIQSTVVPVRIQRSIRRPGQASYIQSSKVVPRQLPISGDLFAFGPGRSRSRSRPGLDNCRYPMA